MGDRGFRYQAYKAEIKDNHAIEIEGTPSYCCDNKGSLIEFTSKLQEPYMVIVNPNSIYSDYSRDFCNGDIVRHFKKELHESPEDDKNLYLYRIISIDAKSTDDYRRQVVYEALYNNPSKNIHIGDIFIRDYKEFISRVDTEKYPNIKQKYRFEIVNRKGEYSYNEICHPHNNYVPSYYVPVHKNDEE